ncbi:MAG: hypothetical protein AAGD22_11570 [Verrucomicrobiota bacterium]
MASLMLAATGMVFGQAPILLDGFTSWDYDDNAALVGPTIPPDPIGAAGPDRLISVGNRLIEMRAKDGSLIQLDSLFNFFSTAPNWIGTTTFDPKIVYDHYAERFVVVTLERDFDLNRSRILVAVSTTSMPATLTAADWFYMGIDSADTIEGEAVWADYPGFEVDEEAVYITNNMFPFPSEAGNAFGVRLWIIDKGEGGGFYAGGEASWQVYDPYANGGVEATTMPALVHGAGGIGPDIGTFLVSYGGFISAGGNEFIQVVRIDDPLGTPQFNLETVNVGDIDDTGAAFLNAPQPVVTTPVWANDRRALDAVWRNNLLWMVTTVMPGSGPNEGQATAYWLNLDTSDVVNGDSPAGLINPNDGGEIGGEDIAPGAFTFFPSVAVNASGDAMFGFSASGPTLFAGAYVTGRRNGDAEGSVRPTTTIQAGVDYYIRTFDIFNPLARNRWGDYSGTAVDPDNETFWVFNMAATERGAETGGGEDGRYGMSWGNVAFTGTSNQAPVVTAAFLTPNPRAFDDETISLPDENITASDPDGDPFGFTYEWQVSANGEDFYFLFPDGGIIGETLAADRTRPGFAYRCCVRAHDQFGAFSDPEFCTDYTFVDSQPVDVGAVGVEYCFDVDLFVPRPTFISGDDRVVINEFNQGRAGDQEWFEFLVTRDLDMRGWTINDGELFWDVRFNQHDLWANVPKGSLILVYNGEQRDPQLPVDDYSFTDGTKVVVIGSTNSTYFDSPSTGTGWGEITDNTPQAFTLSDADMRVVDAISINGDVRYSPVFPLPNIGEFPSRSSLSCNGADIGDYGDPLEWTIAAWNVATPGAANTVANAAFIQDLSDDVITVPLDDALYSFGAGTDAIPGLDQATDIDPETGVIKFTPTAIGQYTVVVNRTATWGSNSPDYTFTLTIASAPPPEALSDEDADGAEYVVEVALNTDPNLSSGQAPIVADTVSMAPGDGEMEEFFTITFARLKGGVLDAETLDYVVAHPDYPDEKEIVYRVECSTDLESWHSGPDFLEQGLVLDDPDAPDLADQVTFRSSASLEEEACQFLRVMVEERDVSGP